jgi:hypothetical protein
LFPFANPTVIISLVSILNTISVLGIVMHKTLGDVGQASLRLVIIFVVTATALMYITTIRYDHIVTHLDTLRLSFSDLVQAIAMLRRRGFRYNKDKTERSPQDGMRTGKGSNESPSEHTPLHISSGSKT